MKIDEVRTSFTVYLIASNLDHFSGIADTLGLAGYLAASFAELTAAFSEVPSNPPHMLLFDANETRFNVVRAIEHVAAQLPESHVFLLTPFERREEFVPLLENTIYDLIYVPVTSPLEVLKRLDRAAERDYFMYLNEQLTQAAKAKHLSAAGVHDGMTSGVRLEGQPSPTAENTKENAEGSSRTPADAAFTPIAAAYAQDLFAARDPETCVEIFLNHAAAQLSACGAVYFKYIANRRVLVAALATNVEGIELGRLGINFNSADTDFKSARLREPGEIREIRDLISDVFGADHITALPVEALGEVQGVAVFLTTTPAANALAEIKNAHLLLDKALSLIEAEKRLHATAVKDFATGLLNRANFINKAQREVSRARRTHLPVALLKIALDPYEEIGQKLGSDEATTCLRVIARILEKQSRVNDVLGRTADDEIGMLLANTDQRGAMIKAERIRRLIGGADFSKVLAAFPRVTLSIGIAEYPSLVRDAEELLSASDEALHGARIKGNATCLSVAPKDFTADFVVPEKEAN